MNTEIVKINASDYGLDETKAQQITKGLKTILAEREALREEYNKCVILEITQDNLQLFKDLRLRIRDNRTKGIEIWHKNNKAYFLAGGNFVDAIKRKEVAENERMEEKLMHAEKFFERQEQDRLEKLRTDRLALLKEYTDIEPMALDHMEQPVFDQLLNGFKTAYYARIAEEKKAEEERIAKEKAEAEERERQRLENIKLKEEAHKREKEIEDERRRIAAENAERERLVEIERKKQSNELAKQRDEAEAERKERERLQAEIERKEKEEQARIVAEKKAKTEAEKNAKLAPDKDKLLAFVQTINDLPRPKVKSIEAADIASKANIMLVQAANFIKETSNKLL